MQDKECWVLCGGTDPPIKLSETTKSIRLDSRKGKSQNVVIKIVDIAKTLITNIPDTWADLLEIAAYVHCADQVISRGTDKIKTIDEEWYRELHFVLPVRQPDFWNRPELLESLSNTLYFLADGIFTFHFVKHPKPPPLQDYFDFGKVAEAEEVLLFSGGLDSLAGAIEEITNHDRHVALVSHRSVAPVFTRQNILVEALRERFPGKKIEHVPIWAHKKGVKSKEKTQRTRSFLFASLAVTTAKLLGLSGIRFYENGVTSINLPIARHLISARASRTTHPQTIHHFRELFSIITEEDFKVENPFKLATKAEVVSVIGEKGCGDLIEKTMSCSGTLQSIVTGKHCCGCTQCVDRRFAILANGYEKFDPDSLYAFDLLTGARQKGEQRAIAFSFAEKAMRIGKMGDPEFFDEFGEASRAIEYLGESVDKNAENIFDLYKRHSARVMKVIEENIRRYDKELANRELPDSCLLVMHISGKILEEESKKEAFYYSPDFRSVSLNAIEYKLSPMQAQVIEILYKQYSENNHLPVSQAYILEEIGSNSKKLKDIFKTNLKAWKDLIRSEKNGFYKLNI